MSEEDLAARWGVAPRTLANKRSGGVVPLPEHFRLGGMRLVYVTASVEEFERRNR